MLTSNILNRKMEGNIIRKVLLLLLILVLLMSIIPSAFAEDNFYIEETDIELEKEKPAVDAYEEIIDGLGILLPHEKDFPNFPENYGGAYYENEKLILCLTDNCEENQNIYNELVSDPSVIVYREVSNSYNDLYNLMMEISKSEFASEISCVGVNELENTVDIGVPKENRDVIGEISNTFAIEKPEMIIYHEEEYSSISTSLKGGMRTYTAALSGPKATLTICGTYGGNNAILTAGHAVKVGYNTRKGSSTGTIIGKGVKRQYSDGQYYDYGVVKVTGDFTLTNKVKLSSNTAVAITSTQNTSSGLVGTTVTKYGATSGAAIGTIVSTNISVYYYDSDLTLYGMVKVNITDGQGKKGDSGGPVFKGHKLYGIYSGDNAPEDNSSSATHYYYSPIYGASGFNVKLD